MDQRLTFEIDCLIAGFEAKLKPSRAAPAKAWRRRTRNDGRDRNSSGQVSRGRRHVDLYAWRIHAVGGDGPNV
jgi:hypothetical protein